MIHLRRHKTPTHGSVTINGHKRSVVTLPEYARGKPSRNKGLKFPAEILTREEIRRLIAACGEDRCADRNRALIVVLWRCGLRIAEALALMPKDVDLDAGTVTVLCGKGGKRRVVGIDPEAASVLERWLSQRREIPGIDSSCPIFCVITPPTTGKQIHDAYVRELFRNLRAKAKIEKRCHPHMLRHTYAYELASEKIPLHVVRVLLGHTSLATTARYIDHLAPDEAITFARERTWERGDA